MARGGRNETVEKDRMTRMEMPENYMRDGQRGSGPGNFEKDGFHNRNNKKTPRNAGKPKY